MMSRRKGYLENISKMEVWINFIGRKGTEFPTLPFPPLGKQKKYIFTITLSTKKELLIKNFEPD